MAVRRLAAHYVLTPEGLTAGGIVTVDGDGRIIDVAVSSTPDKLHGVEFYSGIIIPGMVNCHCHLELSHMKGAIPVGCGFTGFVSGMGSRRDVPDGDRIASATYQDAKMWSEGISVVGDISNSALTFPLKQRSRIKYHTFVEVYGLNTPSAAPAREIAADAARAGMSVSLTPHSLYSLNEGLLTETLSSGIGPLSIHFMESREEIELFDRKGDMWQWYAERGFREDFTDKYDSPADRLIANVPVGEKLMLIHIAFGGREEIEKLNSRYGDRLTWVLCPRSNGYISGQAPPIDLFQEAGCNVSVGTDSLASNHDLSLIEELKLFGDVPLDELFRWATVNGARALGVEDCYGSIVTGTSPGLVLVENLDLNGMRFTAYSSTRRLI